MGSLPSTAAREPSRRLAIATTIVGVPLGVGLGFAIGQSIRYWSTGPDFEPFAAQVEIGVAAIVTLVAAFIGLHRRSWAVGAVAASFVLSASAGGLFAPVAPHLAATSAGQLTVRTVPTPGFTWTGDGICLWGYEGHEVIEVKADITEGGHSVNFSIDFPRPGIEPPSAPPELILLDDPGLGIPEAAVTSIDASPLHMSGHATSEAFSSSSSVTIEALRGRAVELTWSCSEREPLP